MAPCSFAMTDVWRQEIGRDSGTVTPYRTTRFNIVTKWLRFTSYVLLRQVLKAGNALFNFFTQAIRQLLALGFTLRTPVAMSLRKASSHEKFLCLSVTLDASHSQGIRKLGIRKFSLGPLYTDIMAFSLLLPRKFYFNAMDLYIAVTPTLKGFGHGVV